MQHSARYFYQFSALHSLLIGLLPFFIPVMLWQQGLALADISLFIALTGGSFVVALLGWEWLRSIGGAKTIVALSFGLEVALVALLLLDDFQTSVLPLVLLALLNGFYNCFYWTSQRLFFAASSTSDSQSTEGQCADTGRKFGNFQILVVIALKLGILFGAALLEHGHQLALLALTLLISAVGYVSLLKLGMSEQLLASLNQAKPVRLADLNRFSDRQGSRKVFVLDGIFLYLESYFWVLSLYLLSQQNVMQLGMLVVGLTVLLSAVFYLIKNRIDRANAQRVFHWAVGFYALSWLLRASLDMQWSDALLYPMILLIAFLTSFFRLAFNKRFFDIASDGNRHLYLLSKSYYSQLGILAFFTAIYVALSWSGAEVAVLDLIYIFAAMVSGTYLLYQRKASAISGADTKLSRVELNDSLRPKGELAGH